MTFVRIEVINKRALPSLSKAMQQAVAIALREEQKALEKDFALTVRTWKNKPQFVATVKATEVSVATDNPIYGYVNEGTKPHLIRPKKAKALRFYRTGFVAKTTPGVLHAQKGAKATKDLTYTQVVAHPGTKGRYFSIRIAAKARKRMADQFQKTLRKQLRA